MSQLAIRRLSPGIRYALTGLLVLFLLTAPYWMSDFRMSLLAKFLTYAILAIGLDLIWGYTGILSLGHGVFFGLGAYCMAMHLKLASTPAGQLPDFMSWSGVSSMPWFWEPFRSPVFAAVMALLLPAVVAAAVGFLTFRNRIKGAFFSILSQALVIITVTLFVGKQGYTGGTNGLTNFSTFLGFDLQSGSTKLALYYATVLLLGVTFALSLTLVKSRLGKLLIAIRDGENRVRFLGYDPALYKVFMYALSGALAGLAGVLFVLQEGLISPAQMGIVPSIEMVLWVAIGGRATLYGPVIGALMTNAAKTTFSEAYPELWPLLLGGLFVVIVLFLPNGVIGTLRNVSRDKLRLLFPRKYRQNHADTPKEAILWKSD